MFTITTNKKSYKIEADKALTIDGTPVSWDISATKDGHFHIIKNNKSFVAEVVESDYASKTFSLKVNGNIYKLEAKTKFDDLLKQLGMDNASSAKVNDLKAPMPGLVVALRVEEGQSIKKGDPVIVLEAMKMENILKAPADVTIKKINVNKGQAVEKNQVLVAFA